MGDARITYKAICRLCKFDWLHAEGSQNGFQQYVCEKCGDTAMHPRFAPGTAISPMSRTDLRSYFKCGVDSSAGICPRRFTEAELQKIEEMFSHCSCGSRLYEAGHDRAIVRCPECASGDISRGEIIGRGY